MKRKGSERPHEGTGRVRMCVIADCNGLRLKGASRCKEHVHNFIQGKKPKIPQEEALTNR